MSTEYDPHMLFRTQSDAHRFLQQQGFKIGRSKFGDDFNKGLIPCNSDKSMSAADLIQYAKSGLKAPTPFKLKKEEQEQRIAFAQKELEGLAKGIIIDGKVVQQEAEFLLDWFTRHEELAKHVTAVRQLRNRVAKMLEDDVLSKQEGKKLLDIIHRLILPDTPKPEHATDVIQKPKFTPKITPTVRKWSPFDPYIDDTPFELLTPRSTIFNQVSSIDFWDKSFCFTGIFAFGRRQDCEEHTMAWGAFIHKRCVIGTDYVVVGSIASPNWKHGDYGTKIEKAQYYQSSYGRPLIIHEDVWADSLCRAEE